MVPLLAMPYVARQVRKAGRPKPGGYVIARQYEKDVARAFRFTASRLLTDAEVARLARAISASDMAAAMKFVPMVAGEDGGDYRDMLKTLQKNYKAIMAASGRKALTSLDIGLAFDMKNPDAIDWMKRRSLSLIKDMSKETKAAVRDLLTSGLVKGTPVDKTAALIRPLIGLDAVSAGAAMKRLALHMGDPDMSPDRAHELAERYAEQLLDNRAERIARTETIAAEAEGRLQAWGQAQEEGLMGDNPTKRWHSSTEDNGGCEHCAPLDLVDVPLNDDFSTSLGSVSGPPLHQNCRCALSVDLGFGAP
jgi:hypothetical protein